MAASDVPWLGARLREERVRRGITLRGLARDVGVSASMVSQIENGKSRPSVSTLYAITSSLGISIEDVFAPPTGDALTDGPEDVTAWRAATGITAGPAGTDQPGGVVTAPAALPGRRRGPVVRPEDRQVLTLDSGVTWEMLGELPDHPVDFLFVTYPPGSTSSSNGGLMRHSGAEYGFLLSGELILTLGFEEMHLGAGDAISFPSTTPHAYRNDGTEPAIGVWFVIERSQ